MSVISFPAAGSGGGLLLGEAVDRFLDRFRDEPGTAVTYAETPARLTAVAGDDLAAAQLSPALYGAVMARWDERAPATWNKHLAALRSFAAYALRQDWVTADPARYLERRKTTGRGDKACDLDRLMS